VTKLDSTAPSNHLMQATAGGLGGGIRRGGRTPVATDAERSADSVIVTI